MDVLKIINSISQESKESQIYIIDSETQKIVTIHNYPGLTIDGNGGRVFIQEGTCFSNTKIYFRNGGGTAFFYKSKYKITGLTVYLNSCKSLFCVGENFSCVKAECYLYEGKGIYIGRDNQWSFGVQVRNSDAHAIIDLNTKECINTGKDVIIGDHVWIASNVLILKGAEIASNSIVAAGAVVTKKFEGQNVILGGVPAKCIKSNVTWERNFPY